MPDTVPTQTVPTQSAFLTLSGISKRYAGVRALEGVDFACDRTPA